MSTIYLDRTGYSVQPGVQARVRPVSRASAGQGPVRLTRRGRIVVGLLALAVMAAVLMFLGPPTAASNDTPAPVAYETITVAPGQTLWDIASEANPGGDVNATIDQIVRFNSLPNASGLQMGQKLAVPIYSR